MSIPVTYTRVALLAALEAKRPVCVAADKAAVAKHKIEEAAYLKRFREALKEALKWDYPQARKNGFRAQVSASWNDSGPFCPASKERELNVVIASIKAVSAAKITVKSTGRYASVYTALMADVPAPEMCK